MASSVRFQVAVAALAMGFSFAPTPAWAQGKPWDQKAVTGMAKDLAAGVKDLNVTVQKTPDAIAGSAIRRAQYEAREDVRLLVNITQRLASQLGDGEDKDATFPTYKRLQSVRRDAAEAGRRANLDSLTLEKIVSVRGVLDELAPYYDEAPEPPDAAAGAGAAAKP